MFSGETAADNPQSVLVDSLIPARSVRYPGDPAGRARFILEKEPTMNRSTILAVVALALVPSLPAQEIEGTWRLVSRRMPDGTEVAPPAVVGMMTFAGGYRHAVIHWSEGGRVFSATFIRRYELTATEYRETNVFTSIEDQLGVLAEGGKPRFHDVSESSAASPVSRVDGATEFQLPLFQEPKVRLEAGVLLAMVEGGSVDRWERVDR